MPEASDGSDSPTTCLRALLAVVRDATSMM